MEKDFQLTKHRLENIKAIKPLLKSLRTISLSNWRWGLKKLDHLKSFQMEISQALRSVADRRFLPQPPSESNTIIFMLGSSRSLCGSFNRDLFDFYRFHSSHAASQPRVVIFGEKMKKIFSHHHINFSLSFPYPKMSRLDFRFIENLLQSIDYEIFDADWLVYYNDYRGLGRYKPTFLNLWEDDNLLPSSIHRSEIKRIIDTDRQILFSFLLEQHFRLRLFSAFLSSLSAEHAGRFQIMENALSNTDDLIQELTVLVQVGRQRKVTSEMQELSISAGLLKKTST